MSKFKKMIISLVLKIMGKALVYLYKKDDATFYNLIDFSDGESFKIKIANLNIFLHIMIKEKNTRRVEIIKNNNNECDIEIIFKNINYAFKVLIGKKSIHEAYTERAFMLKGDIHKAMGIVRVLYIVEYLLFPKFIWRRILKEKPRTFARKFNVYMSILRRIKF